MTFEELSTKEQFIVVNNHFGLSNKHRLLAADMLCKKLDEMNNKQNDSTENSSSIQKPLPMVLVGDFNQFDSIAKESVLYMDQIEIFKRNGFIG